MMSIVAFDDPDSDWDLLLIAENLPESVIKN